MALIDPSKAAEIRSRASTGNQHIGVSIPPRKIDPAVGNGVIAPQIEITSLWPLAKMRELQIKLDTKIPQDLSILPQVNSDDLSSVQARKGGKVYIQIDGAPAYATLEQIKELNTKTVFVDELTDTKIHQLSNEDIVMLKKE